MADSLRWDVWQKHFCKKPAIFSKPTVFGSVRVFDVLFSPIGYRLPPILSIRNAAPSADPRVYIFFQLLHIIMGRDFPRGQQLAELPQRQPSQLPRLADTQATAASSLMASTKSYWRWAGCTRRCTTGSLRIRACLKLRKRPIFCPVSIILQPQSVADLIKDSFFRWKHGSFYD